MATDYRMTIRTNVETAELFRDVAYEEDLSLGDMLERLVGYWQMREDFQKLSARLMAMKYDGS